MTTKKEKIIARRKEILKRIADLEKKIAAKTAKVQKNPEVSDEEKLSNLRSEDDDLVEEESLLEIEEVFAKFFGKVPSRKSDIWTYLVRYTNLEAADFRKLGKKYANNPECNWLVVDHDRCRIFTDCQLLKHVSTLHDQGKYPEEIFDARNLRGYEWDEIMKLEYKMKG